MGETHELVVNEGVQSVDSTNSPSTMVRKKYRVIAEGGLFKGGKPFPKGSVIELAESTANAFKNAENGSEVEDMT